MRNNTLNQIGAPTASLAMNGQKHINLGAGTLTSDGVNLSQVKDIWQPDTLYPWTSL